MTIAKILVEPRFYFSEGRVEFFMKDVTNTEAVNAKIIEALQPLYPDMPIARNPTTNFYLIDFDTSTGSVDEYFQRISNLGPTEMSINTVIQGHSTITVSLRFNIFDQFPEGLNSMDGEPLDSMDDITEEMLADEEFRTQLLDNGVDLSHLSYESENDLDEVYFVNSAILLGADCRNSSFDDVSFEKAKLLCAKFTESEIQQSNFTEADLRYADFSNIENSYETVFFMADLSHAKFVNSNIFSAFFDQAKLQHADLKGAVFNESQFINADFTGADLTDADLRGSTLTDAKFTGCILTNTKFHGSNWNEAVFDNGALDNADLDSIYVDAETKYDLAAAAVSTDVLPALPLPSLPLINPNAFINNSTITYQAVVEMLSPSIHSVVLPVSKMEVHNWYRVSEVGDTPVEMWTAIGVPWKMDDKKRLIEPKVLATEKPFECLTVPDEKVCEGFVYMSTPDCMAVHDLSGKLDKRQLMEKFALIIGNKELIDGFKTHYTLSNKDLLKHFIDILATTIDNLLKLHNQDDGENGWTSEYDKPAQRAKFIKHALYHEKEGLINHVFFDADVTFNTDVTGSPYYVLYLIMFLNTLPLQMRVYWAQNYIYQFITGYEQTLQTFDPTKKIPPYNFIASCIGGNLEKALLTFRDAINHFTDGTLIQETEAERQENLLRIYTKNVEAGFEEYYGTTEEPSVEGYENYLAQREITDSFTADIQRQYIAILKNDPVVRSKLTCVINRISGGGKKRTKKHTTKKQKTKKQCKKQTKKHTKKQSKKKTKKRKLHKKTKRQS